MGAGTHCIGPWKLKPGADAGALDTVTAADGEDLLLVNPGADRNVGALASLAPEMRDALVTVGALAHGLAELDFHGPLDLHEILGEAGPAFNAKLDRLQELVDAVDAAAVDGLLRRALGFGA